MWLTINKGESINLEHVTRITVTPGSIIFYMLNNEPVEVKNRDALFDAPISITPEAFTGLLKTLFELGLTAWVAQG